MRILITGGRGFIGSHLAEKLNKLDHEVYLLDKSQPTSSDKALYYNADIREQKGVTQALKEISPNIIFHLAAYKHRSTDLLDFKDAIETNVVGSLNLFSAANEIKNLKKIIVLGSAEEYGQNPTPFIEGMRESASNAYSFSKLCQTHLCEVLHKDYRLPFVNVRPTIAYGPGQGDDMFLPALIRQLINKQPFAMTAGEQLRDFVYIDDVVDLLTLIMDAENVVGETLNVGGDTIRIVELAHKVANILECNDLLHIGELLYRTAEVMNYSVDSSKLRELLNWRPKVTLDEGVAKTIDYYLRHAQ